MLAWNVSDEWEVEMKMLEEVEGEK